MNKSLLSILVVAIVIAGGGSFYAGMKYDQSKNPAPIAGSESQGRFQRQGNGGAGGQRGMRNNGGFVSGEVISKDDKSVTIKLQDGGSKIIFFSDSTAVMKSVAGVRDDIAVGAQITASGGPNSDGSISAQSIQIRPLSPVKSAPSSSRSAVDKELTVTGRNYSFSPSSLAVKKGDKVRIIFKNTEGFHDFKIDEFNVAAQKLQTGQEDAVEFTADKTGSFEYYCSVGNHRAMGMKGVLMVE